MTIADPSDMPGGRTIEQLLAECADPFTVEDYDRELAVLHAALSRTYGLYTIEEIDAAMRVHAIPHEEEDLVDRWIALRAFQPYIEAARAAQEPPRGDLPPSGGSDG